MPVSVEDALNAYAHGAFPMGASRTADGFDWYSAPVRSLLPIHDFRISRSLRRLIARRPFTLTADRAFAGVIAACAEPRAAQAETWINADLIALMTNLHEAGFAHSVECWRDGDLVGGLYGVALGGTFCAESMFSKVPNASKLALAYLVAKLRAGGFTLLDTQFLNPHLLQFGAYEMPYDAYRAAMQARLSDDVDFGIEHDPYALIAAFMLDKIGRYS